MTGLERWKAEAADAQARLDRMWKAGAADPRNKKAEQECAACGEKFVHADPRRKTCSYECSCSLKGISLTSSRWSETYK